jgi:5-methylcytosine-specific restriction endonuclease McrA
MTADPRPPKRVRDVNVLKAFRLEMAGEPCSDCELRPGVHVHHIRFRSHSGDDSRENLAWLCLTCHQARHGI